MAVEIKMDYGGYELSEEQKFLFDLKGYIVIPNVFNPEQVAAMREQVKSIAPGDRNRMAIGQSIPSGASEVLFSSPVVKGTLKYLIGPEVRLDNVFSIVREQGVVEGQAPHQGGPTRNPHFHYHFTEGQPFSALTRMVVELNDVGENDGGTCFLAGSQKSNLPIPNSLRERKAAYGPPFEGYSATAGSVVFFSENTCHVGPVWNNPNYPRIAIFMAFCNLGMRWYRYSNVHLDTIEKLGPEARMYFRDVWPWDNSGANEGRNQLLQNDDGTFTVSP